jgi:hypothetical protein
MSALPTHTFGAHTPECLAQMPALIKDLLPFRHVAGVGYVTHNMANLIHKFGLKGSCAEVVRILKELKVEQHFKSERLRAALVVKVMQLEAQVRIATFVFSHGWVAVM